MKLTELFKGEIEEGDLVYINSGPNKGKQVIVIKLNGLTATVKDPSAKTLLKAPMSDLSIEAPK